MIVATLGGAAAVSGEPYWLAVTTNAGTKAPIIGNLWVSGTDLYVAGKNATSGRMELLKLATADASITWQRQLTGTSSEAAGMVGDSSNNIYITGYNGGTPDIINAKYNSSGTIQWQRSLSAAGIDAGYGIAADSSANIYSAGLNRTGTDSDSILVKYDSSGAIQWQRKLANAANTDYFNTVAVDSSNDPYAAGISASVANFAKWNSTGTLQWQYNFSSTSSAMIGSAFNSNALHLVGYESATSNGYIAKLATTPSITWQRKLAGTNTVFNAVDFDSSGNVYVAGYDTPAGVQRGLIAKYDSSGTLQWQRTISQTASCYFNSIRVVGDVIYAAGTSSISSVLQLLIAKVPTDGSLTGTYSLNGTNHTYGASTLTGSTPTFTIATTAYTGSTPTLTDAASTLTDAAGSNTISKTSI